jgi:TonB family protein
MRTALFLLLSVVLHLALLSYPVLFSVRSGEVLLPVIVLAANDTSGGDVGATGLPRPNQERPPDRARSKTHGTRVKPNDAANPAYQQTIAAAPLATADENAVVPVATGEAESVSDGKPGPVRYSGGLADGDASSGGGNGTAGIIGSRSGDQTGSGAGHGLKSAVSYAYTPKPEYPDNARKEGREGTVLVRVLVGEDGKSKSLEVARSSGFEPLDRAAIKAVQSWRFNSAQYGDKRVESWVHIPIVFRLSDPN